MKNILLLLALLLACFAPPAIAASAQAPTDKSPAPDATWLAKARAEYPLKTCVVSEEEIGSMGDGIDHIYKQEGKPDRLVRFCCKNCLKDFNKDPAKYLKVIDEAAAKAKKG